MTSLTRYERMLENYREIDEDAILSSLTEEELLQLEGEIDREVLNKVSEPDVECNYVSTSDDYCSSSDESTRESNREWVLFEPSSQTSSKSQDKTESTSSRSCSNDDIHDKMKKLGHHSQMPNSTRAKSKECNMPKDEEGEELKNELIEAVKQRTKSRNRRDEEEPKRRHRLRGSYHPIRKRLHKTINHHSSSTHPVKSISHEILSRKPKLKKVHTREPVKINEMLHGVSLRHITSCAEKKHGKEGNQFHFDTSESPQTNSSHPTTDYPTKSSMFPNFNASVENTGCYHHVDTQGSCNSSDVSNDDMVSPATLGSSRTTNYDVIGELSINPNSVEDTILKVWKNDENLTEINLNNIQNVNMGIFEELASAMECNTHVKQLSLANVGLTDKPTRALSTMLKRNTTLEKLNLESNFITGNAALRLLLALKRNQSLTELRLDNQRHIFGAKVEHEFSKILKDNKMLLRFGYQFANPGLRMTSSKFLTRNMDELRKKRVTKEKKRAQGNVLPSQPYALRRQTSSEWYRNEKSAKKKELKDQGISLDENGIINDEDVQKVLDQIHPTHFALLEQWFVSRLLGKTEEAAAKLQIEQNKKLHKLEATSHAHGVPPHEKLVNEDDQSYERPSASPPNYEDDDDEILGLFCGINALKSENDDPITGKINDDDDHLQVDEAKRLIPQASSCPEFVYKDGDFYERLFSPTPKDENHGLACSSGINKRYDTGSYIDDEDGSSIDCEDDDDDMCKFEMKTLKPQDSSCAEFVNRDDEPYERPYTPIPPKAGADENNCIACSGDVCKSDYDAPYSIAYSSDDDSNNGDLDDVKVDDDDDDDADDEIDDAKVNDDDVENDDRDDTKIDDDNDDTDDDDEVDDNVDEGINDDRSDDNVSKSVICDHAEVLLDDDGTSSNDSEDVILWKEGDVYDSDEYEVVEIEVTETDESESEEDDKDMVNVKNIQKLENEKEQRYRSESNIDLSRINTSKN